MSKNLRILVGLTAFVALILASALHGAQEYPVLKWHTYAGSSKDDHGASMAVDPSGNIYLAGWSDATWGSPINPHSGGRDAFVAKLNSTGGLEWNTFVGSSDYDEAEAITVDGSGNVYVVGWSGARWGSTGEPFLFGWGAFVAKLNTNGELQWHRFMTPDGGQVGLAAAVDANGDVYVGGWGGLVWETPPSEPASGSFVAKLDSSGAEVWHAFIRDTGPYGLQALAVDVSGNVYAAGRSELPWGSPINPYTGGIDGFVAKLNNTGKLAWNTFMGSSGSDLPEAIALDGSGNVYAAGWSEATWGTPLNPHGGGASDAFAAKLDSSGVRQWNTFMGGTGGWDIAVDGGQNVYVTGVGAAHPGFVAALNRDGALQWNTYLEAILYSIALDQSGNVHVAGSIPYSWGTPVNPWAGGWDAFVAKLDFATPAAPTLYIVSGDKQNGTVGVALPAPLVVLLRSTAGPVAGARVTFSSTGATLNPASVYTSVDGRASSVATPTASGTVTVNVALAGAAPVVFTANVQAAPAPVTFTSAASFRGGPLAAGMIAVAWGQGFTTGTNVASSIPLPTTLGNVTVTVRDSSGTERAQPLFFTSATQINFYLAAETQRGPATIRITGSDARVQTANVTIESVCPGLFSMNADGQGVAAGNVVRVSASGAQTFLDIMRYDNAQRKWVGQPIDFGTPTDRIFLVLYGTGLRNRTSLANVSATIGGIQVQADYLGAQGTLVGLDQFNVELPRATAGMGEVPISLTVDGKTANTVTVTTVAAVVPPPALTSVTPTSARIGETIQSFVITGTNLSGVTAVQFSPSAGITVSNISASASQVTAQLVISADAPVGARSVAVVSPAGTSNALTFTVQQALPTPGVWTGKDIYFFVAADGTHLIVGGPLSRSLQMAIPTCTGSLYIGMDDVIPIINGRFDHTKSGTQSGGWSIAVSGVFDSHTHASVRAQHTDSAGCSKTTTGYEATPSQ